MTSNGIDGDDPGVFGVDFYRLGTFTSRSRELPEKPSKLVPLAQERLVVIGK